MDKLTGTLSGISALSGMLSGTSNLSGQLSHPDIVNSNDYNELGNKPKINGVQVIGEKVGAEYRLQDIMDEITPQDIDNIIYGGL